MFVRAGAASLQGLAGLRGSCECVTNATRESLAPLCVGTPPLQTRTHGRAHAGTRSVSQLAFEEVTAGASTPEHPTASPDRTLFVLHGLLGCGRNWRSWAKRLVEGAAAAAPAAGGPWRALLVDLRCHGASARRPGLNPPHNMATAAEDVARLVYEQCGHQPPAAVLGHSMGGKVALALLELTRARPTGLQATAAAAAAAAATADASHARMLPAAGAGAAAGAAAASSAIGTACTERAGGRVVGLASGGPRDATPRSSAFAPFTTYTSHAAAAAAAASPSAAASAAGAGAGAGARRQHDHHHHHQHHDEGPTCAPPRQVWVLDSQPGLVAAEQDAGTGVSRVLQTVHSVPLPIPNRAWLLKRLRESGLSDALATWLASNLEPLHRQQQQPAPAHHHHQAHHHHPAGHGGAAGGGPLTWTFDIAGAGAMYVSYRTTEFWRTLEQPPPGTAIHLVRGGRSDRWPEDQQRRLQQALAAAAAHAQAGTAAAGGAGVGAGAGTGAAAAAAGGTFDLHVLPRAGHWLHVDDPNGLMQLVLPRLVAGQQ
ncbi:hypothetical protein HYH02_013688 [Chlamydomonas schloesseri]|uniref:AB hydrolase-1 domain-containing protein n=1 Tax=Chlamydomonas schloesseri TaxID=2026947 RepID=A0A835VZG9_9CHLO|nr:hypothetical protein HYH02_013688 [Chlamydomonas schloesseri]|eukprot:KAG2430691.1 hypothetical protein HYH02_013688 [Chlamydomonas schloesseri]